MPHTFSTSEHLRINRGADPLVRAGPPGPALLSTRSGSSRTEQADEGVGRGPGGPPHSFRCLPRNSYKLQASVEMSLSLDAARRSACATLEIAEPYEVVIRLSKRHLPHHRAECENRHSCRSMDQANATEAVSQPPARKRSVAGALLHWLRDLVFSFILAVIVILFLYRPVKVEGTSMMPTLDDQERIFN